MLPVKISSECANKPDMCIMVPFLRPTGKFWLVSFRSRSRDLFQCLLWLDGAVLVDPATSKEAVTYHAMAKQKKADYQDDYK
jgi:hypothetical protein